MDREMRNSKQERRIERTHPLGNLHVCDQVVDCLVGTREEVLRLTTVDLGIELGLEDVVHLVGRLDSLRIRANES